MNKFDMPDVRRVVLLILGGTERLRSPERALVGWIDVALEHDRVNGAKVLAPPRIEFD
jgi:hypothetical protein